MNKSKISSKYQVVIPKKLRKELGLKPGQIINFTRINNNLIIDTESAIKKYAGTMPNEWSQQDPAKVIRKIRDTEWK